MNVVQRLQVVFWVMVFCSLSNSVNASEVPKLPTEHKVVGQATLSVLFWDIYTATLSTPSGNYSPNSDTFTLSLVYLRDIERNELLEATRKQWQRFNIQETLQDKWIETLTTLWPDIKKNDSLTFVKLSTSSQFYFNNQYIGSINDSEFGPAFAAIWLSEQSDYPKLQKKLIGVSQ